jgi:hypothetical protein
VEGPPNLAFAVALLCEPLHLLLCVLCAPLYPSLSPLPVKPIAQKNLHKPMKQLPLYRKINWHTYSTNPL